MSYRLINANAKLQKQVEIKIVPDGESEIMEGA